VQHCIVDKRIKNFLPNLISFRANYHFLYLESDIVLNDFIESHSSSQFQRGVTLYCMMDINGDINISLNNSRHFETAILFSLYFSNVNNSETIDARKMRLSTL
jgi:hypothetical protein